jgi:hypothetical protein
VPSPLIEPTRSLLRYISQLNDAEISEIPDAKMVDTIHKVRDTLRQLFHDDPNGRLLNALVAALASRDGFSAIQGFSDEDTKKGLAGLMAAIQHIRQAVVSPDVRQQVLFAYALGTNARESLWIHTPSIVESRGTVSAEGGHNLSARVTTFEADDAVAAGQVKVDENSDGVVIHFNPSDDGRIGDTVRNAAREDEVSPDQVRANVQSALGTDNRKPVPLETALGFDESIHPDPLRGFEAVHAPDSIRGIGWRSGGKALSSRDAKFLQRIGGKSSRPILVARDSSGVYVISAPPAAPVQSFDLASSTDAFLAVTRDTPDAQLAIHFRGFDDRQAEGFLRNIDAHSEARLSVGSTEEYVSPEKLEEILNGKYDWTRAELKGEPEIIVAADGRSRELRAEISVPAREAEVPGLIVRLKLTISNAIQFTQAMLADLKVQIRDVLLNAKSDDARIVARTLVDELKKDQRFTTVQAQVKHDDRTIFYVKNNDPSKDQQACGFAA